MTVHALFYRSCSGIVLFMVLCLVGCNDEVEIHTNRVPKQSEIEARHGIERSPSASATPMGEPQLMLAAMTPHGETTWFFKILGAPQVVMLRGNDFSAILDSLTFDEASSNPVVELPEGWVEGGPRPMRFKTFVHGEGENKVEMAVSSLSHAGQDYDEYILLNINRWRGQLSLPPLDSSTLTESVQTVERSDGEDIITTVLFGSSPAGGSRPPFAGMGRGGQSPPVVTPPTTTPPSASPVVTYDTPEGWVEKPVSGMRKAAFEVEEGEESIEITVIDLAPGAAALRPNINIWRGQVSQGPVTAEEVASMVEAIEVDGTPSSYVRLLGEDGEGNPKALFAVVYVQENRVWFLKLLGNAPLAENHRERFEAFAKSFRVEE